MSEKRMSETISKKATEKVVGCRKRISPAEHLFALFLGALILFGILLGTGTIHSGYHFMDDHELIRMQLGFEEQGRTLWQAIKDWMVSDFHWRYRPLYWVERLTGAYFWGSDLVCWNYYTAIKGVITFYCLYCMARYLKYNRPVSAIVPCVVMLGTQFTPWYRSANQESTGLLLCAVALYLIARQAYYGKYRDLRYNVGLILCAVLCGLVKESFTLFMPAFVGVKYWLEYWDEEHMPSEKGRWLKCLKNNAVTYGLILLAMLVNVFMILFMVGVDNVSYAGFQEGVALSVYVQIIKNSLLDYTKWYTKIAAIIVLCAIMCYKNIEKKDIRKYFGFLLIGGYICAVQLVAHAKSGMWERYMIPYTLGYALIFILLAYRIFEKDKLHKLVFYGLAAVLLLKTVPVAYEYSGYYAEDGVAISCFLESIKENTAEDDRIVCAFMTEELNIAVECWLETNERTQTYSLVNNEWKNEVQLKGTEPSEFSGHNARAFVCYDWQVEEVLPVMGITEPMQYELQDFDGYTIVLRK